MKKILFAFFFEYLTFIQIIYCENYLGGTKGSNTLLHWNSQSIHYRVDLNGAVDNGLDYNATRNLINAGYSTWENVSSSTVTFIDDGSVTGNRSPSDGINGHYWIYPPDALFNINGIFYDDPNTPNNEAASALTIIEDNNYIITDVDIVYNGNKEWLGNNHLIWWNEVQSVAIHEIGHSLGIAHADIGLNPIPVMTKSCLPSSDRRTLKFDDIDAVSFLYGGNLITNETFSDTDYYNWNLTVMPGVTLTINSGTTLNFNNNASLTINGILDVNGATSSKVNFNFIAQSSSPTNGIKVNSSGSVDIQHANIYNARYGVYSNQSDVNINNSNIHHCFYGLYFLNTNTASSNPIVTNTYIQNNTNYGIYLYRSSPTIDNNKIESNGSKGIYAETYSDPEITKKHN
ncbi:MAG: right-handed parallel beta-helix repeat-containing protein [Ignavibacteriae bacterium]|nr:right-handed parallel beta-helix repeat-containing protein [Ignavibacteriota bacterium]